MLENLKEMVKPITETTETVLNSLVFHLLEGVANLVTKFMNTQVYHPMQKDMGNPILE